MAKLQSSFKNMVLSLTSITLVAAAGLAGVFILTKPEIDDADAKKKQAAIMQVLPQMEGLVIADTVVMKDKGITVYKAFVGDSWVGSAVEIDTRNNANLPFSGTIQAMFGFDAKGNVINYQILSHSETPGLGAKAGEWFAKDGKGSIIGLNPQEIKFSVKKDGGDIDAITAATITSRAFLEMAVNAYNAIAQQPVEAHTGASQLKGKEKHYE